MYYSLPCLPAGAPARVAVSGAGAGVPHGGSGGVQGGGGGLAVASHIHRHGALGGGRAGGGGGGATVTEVRVRSGQPTVVCWTGRVVHDGSLSSEIKTNIETDNWVSQLTSPSLDNEQRYESKSESAVS